MHHHRPYSLQDARKGLNATHCIKETKVEKLEQNFASDIHTSLLVP